MAQRSGIKDLLRLHMRVILRETRGMLVCMTEEESGSDSDGSSFVRMEWAPGCSPPSLALTRNLQFCTRDLLVKAARRL